MNITISEKDIGEWNGDTHGVTPLDSAMRRATGIEDGVVWWFGTPQNPPRKGWLFFAGKNYMPSDELNKFAYDMDEGRPLSPGEFCLSL